MRAASLKGEAGVRGAALLGALLASSSAFAAPKTLGFVIADWNTGIYESKYMDECPEGPAIGNDTLWWRALSREDKDRLTNNGLVQPVDRRFVSPLRGPNGEDVCWNPTVVQDPPLRMAQGPIAYGFNLSGNTDGSPTPRTCRSEPFIGVDGTPGVDNVMYRLLGCTYGWRRNGVLDTFGNEERRNSGRGVILMEIRNVVDELNDDDVEVAFFRSIDPFQIDSAGRILPHSSYRVDTNEGTPRYGTVARGRIENGVLKTEPVDIRLPGYGNSTYYEIFLRDMVMSFDLSLSPEDGKAHGLVGGYYDLDKWWEYMLKIEFLIATGDWSCPALYEAAHRLADGYPDPETGECTAISSAFNFNALPAFVIHGPPPANQLIYSERPRSIAQNVGR